MPYELECSSLCRLHHCSSGKIYWGNCSRERPDYVHIAVGQVLLLLLIVMCDLFMNLQDGTIIISQSHNEIKKSAKKGLFQSIITLILFQIKFYMLYIFYTLIIKFYQLSFRMGQSTFNSNYNHCVGYITAYW